MQKALVLGCGIAAVSAGSIELSSSDLSQSNRGLDNIKAKWSQKLKVMGNDATVTGTYDRAAKRDFLDSATLSGAVAKVSYELKTKFSGATELVLNTKTDDGTTIEAETAMATLSSVPSVKKVSATRSTKLQGQECDLELSHEVASNESKLKLSTLLGSGVKAVGTLTSKGGDHSTTYEVEYDTTLTEGRTLSATVNPGAGTGEMEYVDNASIDGTLTATLPLGGQPKLTLKRAFNF